MWAEGQSSLGAGWPGVHPAQSYVGSEASHHGAFTGSGGAKGLGFPGVSMGGGAGSPTGPGPCSTPTWKPARCCLHTQPGSNLVAGPRSQPDVASAGACSPGASTWGWALDTGMATVESLVAQPAGSLVLGQQGAGGATLCHTGRAGSHLWWGTWLMAVGTTTWHCGERRRQWEQEHKGADGVEAEAHNIRVGCGGVRWAGSPQGGGQVSCLVRAWPGQASLERGSHPQAQAPESCGCSGVPWDHQPQVLVPTALSRGRWCAAAVGGDDGHAADVGGCSPEMG